MVMEVLSEGVLQPKLMDEEVEKATNKNTIIYSKNSLFWFAPISWLIVFFISLPITNYATVGPQYNEGPWNWQNLL